MSVPCISDRSLRRVLLLGLFIAVFQQWCGTNVIFNYAQEIFVGAGFDVDGMFINIVITGIANVVFTIVALYTIEKWGRRTLMLIGAGGLGLIYLTLGTCYFLGMTGMLMVALVVTAISVYAMTLGPVTWTHGHLHLCPMGGMLHAHLLFPLHECSPGQQWHVLDLQRHLHLCLHLPLAPLS